MTTLIDPNGKKRRNDRKMGKKAPSSLTVKERMFCEEVAADQQFSLKNAAEKAGYSNPSQAANKLMRKREIHNYLMDVLKDRVQRCKLTADDVLAVLRDVLYLDPLDLFEPTSKGAFQVKTLDNIPDHVRRCITKLKCRTRHTRDGDTETYIEIELMSKDAALVNAMKHLGLLQGDGINVNVNAGQVINFDELCNPPEREDVVEGKIVGKGK